MTAFGRPPLLVLAAMACVLSAAPSAAEPPAPATVETHTLVHQERTRSYRLRLPKGHTKSKPVPLVLALHGGGGTAEALDRSTNGQLGREADKRGWVVAFPQGVAKGWNDGRPLDSLRDRRRKGVDDVGFLRALIDRVHAKAGIDRARVYATGISNGGFMAYRLALELSDRIAAIAPVTANLQHVHAGKTPKHPVGLLVINGTEDPLVPYAGGEVRVLGRPRGTIFSTDETVARWRAWNACTGEPRVRLLPDRAPRDGTRTTLHRWASCKGGEVVLCRVEGGGHTWPGGTQYLPVALVGRVARDFAAATLIFDFFARHRREPAEPPAAQGDR